VEIRTKIKPPRKTDVQRRLGLTNSIGAARQLLLSIALVAAAGAAHAADLPSKTTPPIFAPPPPPEFTWTGFYLGVSAGYGVDHFAFPYNIAVPGMHVVEHRGGITARGAIVGGQVGFNYQFTSNVFNLPLTNVVMGVEIDDSWSGIRGQTTINEAFPPEFGNAVFGSKFKNFGTLRERIGYALGRFLPYFTAGLTYGTVDTYYNVATNAPFFRAGSSTATRFGVAPRVGVVGIGLEYAFTNNLTVKAEYLYDFINARYTTNRINGLAVDFGTRTMYHIARVGLNYKFDWFSPPPAPVVAKY